MSDNRPVTMHATFYGGPADGGELVLLEPIQTHLRFPITPLEAVELLAETTGGPLVPNNVPAQYRLDMREDRPYRDRHGRVRYLYVVNTQPQPEGHPHE